ncbi:MAG: hypothetical protein ABIL58_05000 [Pseudomonadota bacterium]
MNGAFRLLVLLPALLLAGCAAALPPITADTAPVSCAAPFVSGRWQFTHTVAITVAGKTRGALIGVIRVDTAAAAIHCVLMTVEGMVVFEASDLGGLTVIRALPPFTGDAYAKGLMDDVRLTFLPPEGPPSAVGRTPEGDAACRFVQPGGGVVDIIGLGTAGWTIRRYDNLRRLEKEIMATAGDAPTPAIARRMVLTDNGLPGYRLSMNLIDARPVPGDTP